jgi:hypothetical protein
MSPARLQQLIAARRFEDVSRRLSDASPADLAAIATADLLEYLESLSDLARRAVPEGLWQELRRRRPTETELVLSLAGRLTVAGFGADAGLAIDAALRAAEDKGSLAWNWIMLLVNLGLSVEARARLAGPYAEYFNPVNFACATAQIDLEERKFDAAAARLEPIVRRNPNWLGIQGTIDRARTCGSIAARFAAARQAADGSPDYAVFAINLDEHAERFAALRQRFPSDTPALLRIPGVKGRYLPDVATARLADPHAAMQKGTLGCFLAHVAAWERFRASVFSHGLFIEDDARVAFDLPPTLATLDLPPSFDLCFANYGMEPRAPPGPAGSVHIAPVAATLARKPSAWNQPGGYGYFLSRRGVDKLLDCVARDGFLGDLDWRLLAYSIGKADYERLSPDSFASITLRRQQAFISADALLAAYSLYPALLLPGRVGSTRMADNILR